MKLGRMKLRGTVVGLMFVVAACDGAGPDASATAGDIAVADAWMLPAAAGDPAEMYFTVTNDGSEIHNLVAAEGAICASTDLRMTTGTEDETETSPLEGVTIAPQSSVILGPGGIHVRCASLGQAMAIGDSMELMLRFDNAPSVTVLIEVRRPG